MDKTVATPAEAVADIPDGASLAVGGFGLCGIPSELIAALHARGVSGLRTVSNNCGVDEWGLGILLADRRIARTTGSYVGENKEFARQYLSGELEVELVPQGTLAERLRAGGCGIPGFYTPAGVGTQVADGGLPWRYDAGRLGRGGVAGEGDPRVRRPHVRAGGGHRLRLRAGPRGDAATRHGNLVFHASARNFNPLCAMAGKVTIAEVEELVEPGELDPDTIHLPGIFVQRVVPVGVGEKRIERRTVRQRG